MPIRESSKVLECGFSHFMGKERIEWIELSYRLGAIGVIGQEVSALKLSQTPRQASNEGNFVER